MNMWWNLSIAYKVCQYHLAKHHKLILIIWYSLIFRYQDNFSILNEYVMKFVNSLQSLPMLLNITAYFATKINLQNHFSMDFVIFFGMSFNNKWYFLSQDNIFFTSSLQLIVLATKICPQGKKYWYTLRQKFFIYDIYCNIDT